MGNLKVSVYPVLSGKGGETRVTFYEGDRLMHTLTVWLDDPHRYDGSIGQKHGALREAQALLNEMQEVLTEALKPENDPQTRQTIKGQDRNGSTEASSEEGR